MNGFLVAAAVTVVLVLLLLMRPFFRRTASTLTSRQELNTAIYREQLARLEQDQAEGLLAQGDYVQARAELQRRLLEESQVDAAAATSSRPRRTMIGIGIAVPVVAVACYLVLGNPAGLTASAVAQHAKPSDFERMVAGLAAKLEKEPGNVEGWAMLGRSYKAMGRAADAENAFDHAGAYLDDDAQLLADYADVAVANANGNFAGKPARLLDKALKVDPANPLALWLAGTAAFRAADYDGALRMLHRLAKVLPPGSQEAQNVSAAIAEVRVKAGKGTKVAATAVVTPAAAGASVAGTVQLDATLRSKAEPNDIVMIIARTPGAPMPVAVLRARAAALPFRFSLDDTLAVSPQARISQAREVEVEARISHSGQARPEPGDLMSAAQIVKVGTSGIALNVAQVRQ